MLSVALVLPPEDIVGGICVFVGMCFPILVCVFQRIDHRTRRAWSDQLRQHLLNARRLVSSDGLTEVAYSPDSHGILFQRNKRRGRPHAWFILEDHQILAVSLIAKGSPEDNGLERFDKPSIAWWQYIFKIRSWIICIFILFQILFITSGSKALAVIGLLSILFGLWWLFRWKRSFQAAWLERKTKQESHKLVFRTLVDEYTTFIILCNEQDGHKWLQLLNARLAKPIPLVDAESPSAAVIAASFRLWHWSFYFKAFYWSIALFCALISIWYIRYILKH